MAKSVISWLVSVSDASLANTRKGWLPSFDLIAGS
jgi:hypothetical protein